MKRTCLILLAMVLSLSFTTFALAASTTVPPKYVRLTDDHGNTYVFLIKLAGSVKLSGVSTKFYNINGEFYLDTFSCPLTGSGHVKGTEFHFATVGNSEWGGAFWTNLLEGFWDLADTTNPVGTVTWRRINESGTNIVSAGTLSLTDCSALDLPY